MLYMWLFVYEYTVGFVGQFYPHMVSSMGRLCCTYNAQIVHATIYMMWK